MSWSCDARPLSLLNVFRRGLRSSRNVKSPTSRAHPGHMVALPVMWFKSSNVLYRFYHCRCRCLYLYPCPCRCHCRTCVRGFSYILVYSSRNINISNLVPWQLVSLGGKSYVVPDFPNHRLLPEAQTYPKYISHHKVKKLGTLFCNSMGPTALATEC